MDTLDAGQAIDWPADVIAELSGLNSRASAIEQERVTLLRQKAQELGLAAADLNELRSSRGNSFLAEEGDRASFKRAVEQGVDRFQAERAYLCAYPWFGSIDLAVDSCGWVVGSPLENRYDELRPERLAGSAGVRHYCRVCGQLVGETQHIVS
jgi:hypothetical protein